MKIYIERDSEKVRKRNNYRDYPLISVKRELNELNTFLTKTTEILATIVKTNTKLHYTSDLKQ